MKIIFIFTLIFGINSFAFDDISDFACENIDVVSEGFIKVFDENNDGVLDDFEVEKSFVRVEKIVIEKYAKDNEDYALAGYAWVLKNGYEPDSIGDYFEIMTMKFGGPGSWGLASDTSDFAMGISLLYGCK